MAVCDVGMHVCFLFFDIAIVLLSLVPVNEDSINLPYKRYIILLLIF